MDRMTFYGVFFVTLVPTISIAMSNSSDVDYFQGVETPTSHSRFMPDYCEDLFSGISQSINHQEILIDPDKQKKFVV